MKLYVPDEGPGPGDAPASSVRRAESISRFDVGGWPMSVHLWSAREWAALAAKPEDARPCGVGSWVALRAD